MKMYNVTTKPKKLVKGCSAAIILNDEPMTMEQAEAFKSTVSNWKKEELEITRSLAR